MEKTSKKKIIIIVAALVVVIAAFVVVYTQFGPKTTAGSKNITVEVILEDKSSKTYPFSTDAEYLGEVLKKENLIEGEEGPYGLFITKVVGVAVDKSKEQWWCITKNGETVMTSVDQTPIADGEKYELTFTVGYDQ